MVKSVEYIRGAALAPLSLPFPPPVVTVMVDARAVGEGVIFLSFFS